MVPRFSLVVPAHNEEGYLPRLLDTVELARQRYRGGRDAIELIVADNASTDRTAEVARERGCRVVEVERRMIAAARNGGASVARGEILCFCDADGQVHPETFNEIEAAVESGRCVAGSTGVTLERWSLGLALTYALMLPIVWLTGMDVGVVFCRREDFEAIGGYNEARHFGEDVQFLWDLRKLGKRRGQRLMRVRRARGIASTRKFDRYGDWHYFTHVMWHGWWLITAPEKTTAFARRYWYSDRGSTANARSAGPPRRRPVR